MSASRTDFVVIGGGMAGVSAGYFLAEHGTVRLLERETFLAYHTTGRSAAIFTETVSRPVPRSAPPEWTMKVPSPSILIEALE